MDPPTPAPDAPPTLPDGVLSAFPSLRPPWPAELDPTPDGEPRWGEWDHERGTVSVADPAADPRLPGLEEWVSRGRLIAYRPGWRAVVQVPGDAPADDRWVHLVRVPRTADVVERHLALSSLTRQARGPVRVPEVLDVDEARGVLVLSAVTGAPLAALLDGPVAEQALVAVGRAVAELATLEVREGLRSASPRQAPAAAILRRPPDWAAIAGSAVADPAVGAELGSVVPLLLDDPGAGLEPVVVLGDIDERNVFLHAPPPPGAQRLPSEEVPQVGMTDLDGAGLGEPGRDIASLACHLVVRGLAAGAPGRGDAQASLLLDAYAVAGGDVPIDVVRAWQARTYLRLACIHLSRRETAHLWRELVGRARDCATAAS